MEDYEKKYKEALGRAIAKIEAYNHLGNASVVKSICEIFPDLREYEEEEIRRKLIKALKECGFTHFNDEFTVQEALTWLEKQSKESIITNVLIKAGLKTYKDGNKWCILVGDNIQEGICGFGDTVDEALFEFLKELVEIQNIKPKFKVGDTIRPKGSMAEYTIESISGGCYHGKGWGLHISGDDDYELVEQKPTDNIEPKFKVGDWIIDIRIDKILQIQSVDSNGYDCTNGNYFSNSALDNYRLWTIL